MKSPLEFVPVEGGELAVGTLGHRDPAAPTVLAVHGITATHMSWLALARELPGVRIIAPDLRGRGRSNGLPAPVGLRQHAADLERVLDHFAVGRVPLVGHSMGAFVSVVLAARVPDRVTDLVLVDGGFPLQGPEVSVDDLPTAVLGPAAARLSMVFASREEYRAFWRRHPAFAGAWNDDVEAYVDYDLCGTEPFLRSSSAIEAVSADSRELYGPEWFVRALRGLRMPVAVLRAARDLLDQPGGLYPAGRLDEARALVPQLDVVEIDDVNHYTIVMAQRGARRVAAQVGVALSRSDVTVDNGAGR